MTMVGTPPKVVIRFPLDQLQGPPASQRCIMTSLPPARMLVTRIEWHPVA